MRRRLREHLKLRAREKAYVAPRGIYHTSAARFLWCLCRATSAVGSGARGVSSASTSRRATVFVGLTCRLLLLAAPFAPDVDTTAVLVARLSAEPPIAVGCWWLGELRVRYTPTPIPPAMSTRRAMPMSQMEREWRLEPLSVCFSHELGRSALIN